MGGKVRNTSAVDYSDIQGLVRFGYGALSEACFLLLNIRDARGCTVMADERASLYGGGIEPATGDGSPGGIHAGRIA